MFEQFGLYQRRLARANGALAQAEALIEQRSLQLYEQERVRHAAELALRESEERYRLLVELSPDAILLESAGQIVFVNAAAVRLFKAGAVDALLGKALNALLPESNQAHCIEGSRVDVAISQSAFHYRGQRTIQMVVRDISERTSLERKLRFKATHDELTGLPTRALFLDRIDQAIHDARRRARRFAVCFIDLDRFKWINDSLGHEAGDEFLVTIAQRLNGCLREADFIARFGGDEFVLLLSDVQDAAQTALLINRVIGAVARPMQLHGHEVAVTCSVGCSLFPVDGQDAPTLLRQADAAMYAAKSGGRNCVRGYSPEQRLQIDERLMLESQLRHAIERGELELFYQPQIALATGRICEVEALLRWRHPTLGLVAPARFIGIAEENGMIAEIGEWALLQACKQNKAWQDAGIAPVRVAVNLSVKQLKAADLPDRVANCLDVSGLEPGYLVLELTESASMDEADKMIGLLTRLRALGVHIAIDDFGTGYSNMSYLTRLPISSLKLDGAFVQQLATDPASQTIVEAMVAMAHGLGLSVVAEMVETEAQVLRLQASNCDLVQGYYYCQPVPADECATRLLAGRMALPCKPYPVELQQA